VHTDERAWRIGADGERKVADRLARLPQAWTVLHALPVGARGADIDHLVIGPGGVFTINTKHHPDARIWVGGDTFLVNGKRYPYVRNARHEAARLLVPVRIVRGLDDSERIRLGHVPGEHAGEISALVGRGGDVGDEVSGRVVRLVVRDDGNLRLLGDLGRSGVVAAGLRDDEVGSSVDELAEDRAHVLVTGAVGDLDLSADRFGGLASALDALLVPAVVVRLRERVHEPGEQHPPAEAAGPHQEAARRLRIGKTTLRRMLLAQADG
jgi:hypothetical protein